VGLVDGEANTGTSLVSALSMRFEYSVTSRSHFAIAFLTDLPGESRRWVGTNEIQRRLPA